METLLQYIESIVLYGYTYVWERPEALPWLVVLLLATGLFITLRMAFIQLRRIGHAIAIVMGRYDDPNDAGDVTHFQALSTALSATVGIGNIAGVAIAIHYGGPGSVFWMWVTAALGMALKYAECTLSVHYRSFDDKGEVAGGPMYYIERGLGKGWKPLAMFFAFAAIFSSFGSGNMSQANTVTVSAQADFGIAPWMVGALLVVVVGAVILGGIKSIARVSSTLAPAMAVIYVAASLLILGLHIEHVPDAFATIFANAFTPAAGVSGSVVGTLSVTLLWGVKRGLFSNEAGQGSSPIAHAAAKTDEPVREGLVAMLEPLIDTLIICSMTALVIVITGVWDLKKPDVRPVSALEIVALADAQAGPAAQAPRAASDAVIDVTLAAGAQAEPRIGFRFNHGLVGEPRIVTSNGTPVDGTLRYEPATGKLTIIAQDGSEVAGPRVSGDMLQTSSALTGWAFQLGLDRLGGWGSYVVTLCVFLFGISTIISWSYYGDRCVTYLFGDRYVIVYRVFYLGFVYLGATTALETVWAFGDLALGFMTVPNLIAVGLLTPKLVELSRDYFSRMKDM